MERSQLGLQGVSGHRNDGVERDVGRQPDRFESLRELVQGVVEQLRRTGSLHGLKLACE